MVRPLTLLIGLLTMPTGACFEARSRLLEEGARAAANDASGPTDAAEPECASDGDCAVGCRGQCCGCPEVVPRAALIEDPELNEPRPYGCRSICTEHCAPCPAEPVPACVRGRCVPREGCSVDRDCVLARDCRCGCIEAVSQGVLLSDACLTPLGDEGSCAECPAESGCGPCPPEPAAARCSAGSCQADMGMGPLLAPCGGQLGECTAGFSCFPGRSDCGFGGFGVCIPDGRPRCGGATATPCSGSLERCVAPAGCDGCEGACLSPAEIDLACSAAPGCFDCEG